MGTLVRYGNVVQVISLANTILVNKLKSFRPPTALAFEIQQIFDRQQTTSRPAREERNARLAGPSWKRRFLVLHFAFLQIAIHWRHGRFGR